MASTIIISIILVAALAAIVRKLRLDRRTGKTCCGDCAHCHGGCTKYEVRVNPREKRDTNQ